MVPGMQPKHRHDRVALSLGTGLAVWVLCGCEPTQLGQCDLAEAETVVFDQGGTPAFAGEALVLESCSSCHSAGAEGVARRGAPAGLDFTLGALPPGDDGPVRFGEESPEQLRTLDALGQARTTIFDHRFAMYDTVADGSMPPRNSDLPRRGYTFADGTPLPSIQSVAGQEIYRGWLACNGPIVARLGRPSESEAGQRCDDDTGVEAPVGACVIPRPGDEEPIDPSWPAIRDMVFSNSRGGCLLGPCHGATSQTGAELILDIDDPTPLIGASAGSAEGAQCSDSGLPIVMPGSPEDSLLYDKLLRLPGAEQCTGDVAQTTCGAEMPPQGGTISRIGCNGLAAVREWIANL